MGAAPCATATSRWQPSRHTSGRGRGRRGVERRPCASATPVLASAAVAGSSICTLVGAGTARSCAAARHTTGGRGRRQWLCRGSTAHLPQAACQRGNRACAGSNRRATQAGCRSGGNRAAFRAAAAVAGRGSGGAGGGARPGGRAAQHGRMLSCPQALFLPSSFLPELPGNLSVYCFELHPHLPVCNVFLLPALPCSPLCSPCGLST